jgi:hypothetical protein
VLKVKKVFRKPKTNMVRATAMAFTQPGMMTNTGLFTVTSLGRAVDACLGGGSRGVQKAHAQQECYTINFNVGEGIVGIP